MSANVLESLLSSVEKKINNQRFSTWFRPTTYSHSSETSIFVKVPDPIFVEWIHKNYTGILDESMEEQGLLDQKLQFLIDETSPSQIAKQVAAEHGLRFRDNPEKSSPNTDSFNGNDATVSNSNSSSISIESDP